MTALTTNRSTVERKPVLREFGAKAGAVVHQGSQVAIEAATGLSVPASAATGLIVVGRAEYAVDNTDGQDGDQVVKVRSGCFLWANDPAVANTVKPEHIGSDVYVLDDQTVTTDDAGGNAPVAGRVFQITDNGVWVTTP